MAALVDVICSRDIGSGVLSWSQAVQTAVPTADKAAQCTRPESRREATQTDLMQSSFSAGCQTEDALPETEVDLVKTGVTCKRCCKFFHQKSSADRHWRLYHTVEPPEGPQEPYYCPYCFFCSFTRKSVKVHERRTHTEEAAQSSTRSSPRCSARCFPQKTSQLVIRKFCPQRFIQETKRYSHERKHTRSRPYVCDVCQKSYFRKRDLVAHAVTHTLPFECDICQKLFSRKESLVAHTMNHVSKKPFECEVCQKGFTRKHCFTAHQKLHTEPAVKVYSCSICQESFSYKGCLVDHEKRPHISVNEKAYVCIVCHEVFPQRAGLLDHHCTSIRSRMVAASLVAASLQTASLDELA